MNKKTIIGIAVVAVIIVLGVVILKSAQKRDSNLPIAKSYAIVASTIKPVLENVQLTLPYLAIVENDKDVVLAAKIATRIDYLKPSGSFVNKGDVIVHLDNTSIVSSIQSIKAKILSAQTGLKNLQATHKRTLELLAVKGASIEQSEMEISKIAEIESNIEGLNQNLNNLNNNLSYANILAPTSGRVSNNRMNVGDIATPGRPIISLKSQKGFSLLVRVPTDLQIWGVVSNNKSYDAIPLHSTFNGLAEYKVFVDETNLTADDRVEVAVEVYKGKAIKLPFDAILDRNGKSFVLVRNGEKVESKEVQIIQSGEQGVVISNNNLEGKEIVVAKQDILLKLLSGISLKVKED
ncbi:efflux RND transporter periplasmic adaptor subunit [Ancylomarina longa]|uniref:Efflux transporter periplasmic adaptor subunit n=1 Tax=Ancylomarina longa TaxID=2487017 RepID=A0A434AGT8_9BACT|nr:efflux transporter periplasmic adaptor subunit [Ancylomarina longa]RUT73611.1 efflux transporter periplasmic adaptor subunit [Ancylomarina longa]